MKRYLLDTGIAGDYIFRRRGVHLRVRDAFLQGNHIGISYPVLGELWAGMELSSSREINVARLKHAVAKLRIWPFERQAAEEYGKIFAELRRQGVTIDQVDMQSAAIARTLDQCVVVTKDGDLGKVTGLVVENWAV
jgi:tRNA(fMet)-specific endonuclease VapC